MSIGIFDSGVGGLSAYRALKAILPDEKMIYFGDTARVPYGVRSADEIRRFAFEDAGFLIERGVSAILVACGTVSSNSLGDLEANLPVPVVGVIKAAAKRAAEAAEAGNMTAAVIGTTATVNSRAFEKAIKAINPEITVISRACPDFVTLAESGRTADDDLFLLEAAHRYLDDIIAVSPSALILGCTHFPLLSGMLRSLFGKTLLVDSSAESAGSIAAYLKENDMLCGDGKNKSDEFYVSGEKEKFTAVAKSFLGLDLSSDTQKVKL